VACYELMTCYILYILHTIYTGFSYNGIVPQIPSLGEEVHRGVLHTQGRSLGRALLISALQVFCRSPKLEAAP